VQSAILSALIRSPYSRGSTTAAATAARTKTRTRTGRRMCQSTKAAAETTSDDCCEVCIVAPRAGFALVQCGYVDSIQDDAVMTKKTFRN